MILLYSLANHKPVLNYEIENENYTVRSIRDIATAQHSLDCKVSRCRYAIQDAWVSRVEKDEEQTKLGNFFRYANGSHIVSLGAHVNDAFPPSKPGARLVFAPYDCGDIDDPPEEYQILPAPSNSSIENAQFHSELIPESLGEETEHNLKRKTPDYELDEDLLGDVLSSRVSLSSGSSPEPSKRSKTNRLSRIHGAVYSHSQARYKYLPKSSSDFHTIIQDHSLYVDKSPVLERLYDWNKVSGRIPVIRRPHGFGLRTCLSTIDAMHDHTNDYESQFEDLGITTRNRWTPYHFGFGANDILVLRLDLAHPSIQAENMERSLRGYVENEIDSLFANASSVIQPGCGWTAWSSVRNIGMTVRDLGERLQSSGSPPLFLIIENATAPLSQGSHVTPSTRKALWTFFRDLSTNHTETFVGVVVTAYLEDDNSLSDPLTDVFPFGRGAYIDVTTHPAAHQFFGFTRQEVEDLVAATQDITSPDSGDIWEMLEAHGVTEKQWSKPISYPEYFPDPGPPVFSMRGVLQVLAVRCGQQNSQPLDSV